MDLNKIEISVVEDAAMEVLESHLRELDQLQLAMVGGGIGETVLV